MSKMFQYIKTFLRFILEESLTFALVLAVFTIYIADTNKKIVYDNCYYGNIKSCLVIYDHGGLEELSRATSR